MVNIQRLGIEFVDVNSNPNEWSHSWAMRKLINSTEKTITDSGNGEKRTLPLDIEKNCLERTKNENNAY